MRSLLATVLLLCISVLSCSANEQRTWEDSLVAALFCGMTKAELESKASVQLESETRLRVYGSHSIRHNDTTLWLDFNDDALQSYMIAEVVPWKLKGVRVSPQMNLCTRDLSFFLRLDGPIELEEAEVYLDDEKLMNFRRGHPFKVSIGRHQIRVEKEGCEPIVEVVEFAAHDPGEIWLDISALEATP